MRPALFFFAAFALLTAGCASTHEKPWTDSFTTEPGELASVGRNPYFILEPGYRLVLEGKEGGKTVTLTITVLAETKTVAGVETRVVEERETKEGEVIEVSRNYFAYSKKTGDLYYFGEDVDEYKQGKVASHGGSWKAGENGARFGLLLPGAPHVGDRAYQEVAPGVAMDRAEVVSVAATIDTPAGRFEKCLEMEENNPLEKDSTERKIYAPGIGLARDGKLLLVKYGRGSD